MKPHIDIGFLAGIIAVCLIVILGVITGTYYGTRPPLGTLMPHYTLSQAQ